MQVTATALPGVLILEPKVFEDARGFFFESFNAQTFAEITKTQVTFVQDNHSGSKRNVVRGLHYQIRQPQGKLVRAVVGRVLDVAVDLRRSSPTFGKHVAVELSASNRRLLWMPAGLAHGFSALDDWNEVLYKATDYYAPAHERSLLWNDPQLAIDWKVDAQAAIVAPKDLAGALLSGAESYD
ncbi:MAG: dTDP-4-dehydrorhamnose 3,5-epimerase [Acidobacteriaceae bacterium]